MCKQTIRISMLLTAVVFLLSGCDFFRSLVGKPTSEELEVLRLEAAAKAERQRHVEDSLKAVAMAEEQALEQDSASAPALEPVKDNDPRYHVIIGSFKEPGNAERFIALLKSKGYTPKSLKFRNGFDAISIFSSDNYYKARQIMEDTVEFDFCPEDIWIYDLAQHLHE